MSVRDLEEQLRFELADIMLEALKEKAGVFMTTDEWYKAREKLAEVISVRLTIK